MYRLFRCKLPPLPSQSPHLAECFQTETQDKTQHFVSSNTRLYSWTNTFLKWQMWNKVQFFPPGFIFFLCMTIQKQRHLIGLFTNTSHYTVHLLEICRLETPPKMQRMCMGVRWTSWCGWCDLSHRLGLTNSRNVFFFFSLSEALQFDTGKH